MRLIAALFGLILASLPIEAKAQNVICPTAPLGTSNNQCASTAFVQGTIGSNSITIGTTVIPLGTTTATLAGVTSYNKVTITAPATGSTLTIANGKTLTASASITLAGTDGTSLSLAGNLTTSGAFGLTFTVAAATNSTLPSGSHTLAGLDVVQTWTAAQSFASGDLNLSGATSGTLTLNCAAVCGSNTITWPAGTTDFSATGGTSQVIKQTTSGGAFTVARLACADLSDAAATCSSASGGSLVVGTTVITGGTTTRILRNSAGVLGEYTITGTGTVVAMQTAPTFVTSITTPIANLSGTSNQLVFQSSGVTGTMSWAPASTNKTLTWPNGTTDFTGTGGTSQVVKQTSVGGAFTVAQLACADLSNATSSCSATPSALTKTDDTNVTLTLGGTPATALLQATSLTLGWTGQLGLTRGGTAASLTASTGGIVYSGASALAILSGTATARQMLQSGASAAPAWSTTTWPATTTINRLLYSSAANVISDLATANSSILVTDGSGVPSLSTTLPAHTLGGTVSGGGNQINNVIIGTSTPLAGHFTTLSASDTTDSSSPITGAITSAGGIGSAKTMWAGTKFFVGAAGAVPTGATAFAVGAADSSLIGIISGVTHGIRIGAGAGTATLEGVDNTGTGSFQPLVINGSTLTLQSNGGTNVLAFDASLNAVFGTAALVTTATNGFVYIATTAGQPTGVPTSFTGRVPLVYDTTNHQFWIYDSGWKQPKTPAAAAIVTWQ